jgi:hypothetical protein
MGWVPARGPYRGVAMLWSDELAPGTLPDRLEDFLAECGYPFIDALESVEEVWEGALSLEAAVQLLNESLVGIGAFVSVVRADAWEEQVDGLEATWSDGLATRFLRLAAIAALGARLTAPPTMPDGEAATYGFSLVRPVLERHRPCTTPVGLHLFLTNCAGKLLRHHRLLESASLGDSEAAGELALLYPAETDATRSLTLHFMALSAAALGAVYLLDLRDVSFIPELAGRLPRPVGCVTAG